MLKLGLSKLWVNVVNPYVHDILAMVLETWESMPAPDANELEDVISERLCRRLRQSRDSYGLPFRIDTQLVELDPAEGQKQGRMDIVFSPTIAREDIYFCLECKRINVQEAKGVRPYFAEYVRFGMLRFVSGQYASSAQQSGMLAFVLNGDLWGAMEGVEKNIKKLANQLGMDAPGQFLASTMFPGDFRIKETHHRCSHQPHLFVIHHLFLAKLPVQAILPELSAQNNS